jgi:hypothetical protein
MRDTWVLHGVETTFRDVRFALRGFSRAPGFTAAAILVLAFGIGANAAIFSLIRTIVLQPLPFQDSGQLVNVWTAPPGQPDATYGAMVPDYLAWRSQNASFTALAACPYQKLGRRQPVGRRRPLSAFAGRDIAIRKTGSHAEHARWRAADRPLATVSGPTATTYQAARRS